MTLLDMARAYPEMSVTVKLGDLLEANRQLVAQARKDAEEQQRRRDQAAGCALVLQDKVAEDLHVSARTLWRWGKIGLLNPVKFGGKVYYRQAEIEAIVEAHTEK